MTSFLIACGRNHNINFDSNNINIVELFKGKVSNHSIIYTLTSGYKFYTNVNETFDELVTLYTNLDFSVEDYSDRYKFIAQHNQIKSVINTFYDDTGFYLMNIPNNDRFVKISFDDVLLIQINNNSVTICLNDISISNIIVVDLKHFQEFIKNKEYVSIKINDKLVYMRGINISKVYMYKTDDFYDVTFYIGKSLLFSFSIKDVDNLIKSYGINCEIINEKHNKPDHFSYIQ